MSMSWHAGDYDFDDTPVRIVRRHWRCPIPVCGGEMIANGVAWPMSPMGYHHYCDKCGLGAATTKGSFPSIHYKDSPT